ncbi:MAG: Mrp/NBP35 family ATP-binding protein [Candidatus Aenigmarchaeota archaeon]|nr:Mrp/NBP35 family ATP-binding protein [Candidatus Aenigmarchaeota archaeon]
MNIKRTILVMSGKGGVGKTTVAVNLAYALSERGYKVGILDADLHGPNVPKMLGVKERTNDLPIEINENLKLVSMSFLIDEDKALIWRGPLKHKFISEILSKIDWGDLDFLIVDLPAGTGDESISVAQISPGEKYSLIISMPQEVSMMDARRAYNFSKKLGLKVIGFVENMSGEFFGEGGVEKLAKGLNENFLGKIHLDKNVPKLCDEGKIIVKEKTMAGDEINGIVDKILEYFKSENL